jgi:hypothetical protein
MERGFELAFTQSTITQAESRIREEVNSGLDRNTDYPDSDISWSLTERSTTDMREMFLGSRTQQALKADNLTAIC